MYNVSLFTEIEEISLLSHTIENRMTMMKLISLMPNPFLHRSAKFLMSEREKGLFE